MTIHNTTVANPAPGHYDSNTTGGYGTGNNRFYNPDDRIGPQTYPYNSVSAIEKELHQDDLKKFNKKNKRKTRKNRKKRKTRKTRKTRSKIKLQNKLSTCIGVSQAYDSLAKNDKFSYNGLSNTSAYLGLAASNKRQGELIREFIREAIISETKGCMSETKGCMSGRRAVQAAGLGNHYPKKNTLGSGGGLANGAYVRGASYGGDKSYDSGVKKMNTKHEDEIYEDENEHEGLTTGEIMDKLIDFQNSGYKSVVDQNNKILSIHNSQKRNV